MPYQTFVMQETTPEKLNDLPALLEQQEVDGWGLHTLTFTGYGTMVVIFRKTPEPPKKPQRRYIGQKEG